MLIEYGIARRKPAMPSPARLVRPTLLAAALCAANLVVAAQPASAPFSPAQQQAIRQISASEAQAQVPLVASAAAASVAKTIEGEKQAIDVAKDALEVGRKSVDWWLSALGLLMAVAGIGIPFLMGRQQKAEWKERLDEISGKLAEANAAKEMAEAAQQQAEQHAREIETLLHTARDKTSLIPSAEDIKGELSGELLAKLQAEKPPQVVKLIQQAWEAHNKEDWAAAKPLWALLSLIESQDANVWFNLAYAEEHAGKDFQLICDGYQRSQLLQPSADACNNWGNVLCRWANTLTGEAQQQRFAEADQRYAEATRLKPDDADAYYNWGNALSLWAQTLTGDAQQQRFAEADQRFAEAARLKSDDADCYHNWGVALSLWVHTLPSDERAAKLDEAERVLLLAKDKGLKNLYNLACLRAIQQRPDEARTLLEETRAAGLLPNFAHLSTDRDLENLRGLDWFQALLAEVKQQEAGKQGST